VKLQEFRISGGNAEGEAAALESLDVDPVLESASCQLTTNSASRTDTIVTLRSSCLPASGPSTCRE